MKKAWSNIALMMVGQGSSLAVNMISVSYAVLIGAALADDARFATLPQALLICSTAVVTGPISLIMGRYGRRAGFLLGALAGVLAALIGVGAILIHSFALFCLATACLGATNAAAQYYRFAAGEAVSPAQAPKAMSAVLLGGIVAALTVPFMTDEIGGFLNLPNHGGAFAVAGVYAAIAILPALFAKFAPLPQAEEMEEEVAPLKTLVMRPLFIAGVITAAGGQALMNLLMTATPLAMAHAGHGAQHSTQVIQMHVIAMFLPSLISGWLIAKLGATKVVALGLIATIGSVIAARAGLNVGHFTISLILLGIGWNFLFLSGTTVVASSLAPHERARVQGVNDTIVFGVSALAALSSGALLTSLSWSGLATSSLALIALIIGANIFRILWERKAQIAKA